MQPAQIHAPADMDCISSPGPRNLFTIECLVKLFVRAPDRHARSLVGKAEIEPLGAAVGGAAEI